MSTFLTIENSFRHYAEVMALWRIVREKYQPHFLAVHYEDLIDDPKQAKARVIDFLGLEDEGDWVPPHEHARARAGINTPSRRQVLQPLYRRSSGRWRRYETHLRPYIELIRPYAEEFGYDIRPDN